MGGVVAAAFSYARRSRPYTLYTLQVCVSVQACACVKMNANTAVIPSSLSLHNHLLTTEG